LGVWAADNTQMFYPPEVDGARLVGAMLSAVDQITKECEISIGLCAHRGEFYVLGGGVYGPDADRVEVVAEDHTEGGELLVTDTLAESFAMGGFTLAPRDDLAPEFG